MMMVIIMINVIYNKTKYDISQRKIEGFEKYNKIIQWGRRHPVRFMERFLGLEFTDHQKYILLSSWTPKFIVWLMSRNSGKSYLAAPFLMAKSILIPDHHSYILSVTGSQSIETFTKLEQLALGNLASVTGTTSVFIEELMSNNAANNGFVHDKNSHSCKLYNGSSINTLNSIAKNIVGIRSNLNFYDEAGKIQKDFYDLTKPFTAQDTDFITGSGINSNCYPKQMQNQILYASSAEDIFTELFDAYKDYAMQMIMGSDNHFVCDIDCRFSLEPFMSGKPYNALVSREIIDDAFNKNEFKANREYFNKFDTSGGQDSLIKNIVLIENSFSYIPIFESEENGKIYLIAYDPSSKLDNSMTLVAELFKDATKGWMLKIVNCKNLIENKKNTGKKVIQKPDQLEIVKEMILDYNGSALEYKGIERLLIDAGAGGGGFDMSQFLLANWVGKDKKEHLGLIDKQDSYTKEIIDRFPQAVDVLTLVSFTKDKVKMYEDCQDAINQGLVMFPKDLNHKGEMEFKTIGDDDVEQYMFVKLNQKEAQAVTEIEILKLELIAMQKTKNSTTGKISFDTLPSKKLEGLKDDRADCMAMLCGYLMNLRARDKISGYEKPKSDFSKIFSVGSPKIINPFGNSGNPFSSDDSPF